MEYLHLVFCRLLIFFENLFKPRQRYLQPQSYTLSSLRLAS
ncbi:DNA alkylation repair protein [Streptococcus shenyangsis]|uniref:DNA alkylation repair protein n=1 Tax=Streptococcus shenyangsis TaxID=2589786 RepID=A0ABY2YLJ0_9STRE|nr:DNA alkylation repair protein [Streptococcus shenyangsis]TPE40823.1 DNA alkylation repair protein [Streptococcus sp. D2]